jgi:hypothetical protein
MKRNLRKHLTKLLKELHLFVTILQSLFLKSSGPNFPVVRGAKGSIEAHSYTTGQKTAITVQQAERSHTHIVPKKEILRFAIMNVITAMDAS